jgi:hypothetical protein
MRESSLELLASNEQVPFVDDAQLIVNDALGGAFVGAGALVGGGSTAPVPDPFTRSSLFGVFGPS